MNIRLKIALILPSICILFLISIYYLSNSVLLNGFVKIEDDQIIISISDSGPTISENIVLKIMDPFFTTKASGKGTELGISISRTILESHGGSLTLETTPFTKFNLEFPKK